MYFLELKISFDSVIDAKNFFKSIKPELVEFERSSTKISLNKNLMKINISASDKTATRASLNTIFKPLILFNELGEII